MESYCGYVDVGVVIVGLVVEVEEVEKEVEEVEKEVEEKTEVAVVVVAAAAAVVVPQVIVVVVVVVVTVAVQVPVVVGAVAVVVRALAVVVVGAASRSSNSSYNRRGTSVSFRPFRVWRGGGRISCPAECSPHEAPTCIRKPLGHSMLSLQHLANQVP